MKKLRNYVVKGAIYPFILGFLVYGKVSIADTNMFCFKEAGVYFNIDPVLLRSIAVVESNLKPESIGKNMNAEGKLLSKDYGLMQINDIHIPALVSDGIISSERDLIENPCLNIKIGAWILYKHFRTCGINWPCLGSYNAGFSDKNTEKRKEYVARVYNIYLKEKAR